MIQIFAAPGRGSPASQYRFIWASVADRASELAVNAICGTPNHRVDGVPLPGDLIDGIGQHGAIIIYALSRTGGPNRAWVLDVAPPPFSTHAHAQTRIRYRNTRSIFSTFRFGR